MLWGDISKIGIYDENKNLIGVATLSNPILKKENEDLTFKMKLDIWYNKVCLLKTLVKTIKLNYDIDTAITDKCWY